MTIKRLKKGHKKSYRPKKKSAGRKMGRKFLETQIGPQNTWAKSYMAPMTHQRTPWRTHGAYMANQICDRKKSYVEAFRDGKFRHRLLGSAHPRVG